MQPWSMLKKPCLHQNGMGYITFLFWRHMHKTFWTPGMVSWELKKTITTCFLQKNLNPSQVYNAPCFNRIAPNSSEVLNDDASILFLLYCIISLVRVWVFKLEIKFSFSYYVDRSPVMCSLVRTANSLDSFQRLPVKAYLSRFSNLIFKYLGFGINSIWVHVH